MIEAGPPCSEQLSTFEDEFVGESIYCWHDKKVDHLIILAICQSYGHNQKIN